MNRLVKSLLIRSTDLDDFSLNLPDLPNFPAMLHKSM